MRAMSQKNKVAEKMPKKETQDFMQCQEKKRYRAFFLGLDTVRSNSKNLDLL